LLQLEELDNERLNELESILYASIHYSDGAADQGAGDQLMLEKQPTSDQDADARSMPPPSLHQKRKNPPSGQQASHRFVSETRVINNQGRQKPRYWMEGADGQVRGPEEEYRLTPNKSNIAPENPPAEKSPPFSPKNGATPNQPKTPNQSPKQHQQNAQAKQHQNQQSNKQHQNQAQKQQQSPHQKQQQNQAQKQQQSPHQKQQQKPQINQQQKQQQNNQKPKQQPQNQQTKLKPKDKPSPQQSPVVQKPKGQAINTATKVNHEAYEEERFDQRLLVAIPPNCLPKKQNKPQQQKVKQQNKQQQNKQQQQQTGAGPFGKSNRKLEQMQRLAAKKEKSKQARANKKQRKQLNAAPVEFVDLAESEISDSSDDVVHVPLPPVPVIDLDGSDTEQPSTSSAAASGAATAAEVYHEENAMDAADVRMSLSCITEPVAAVTGIVPPSMHSPCSSVMSSDDFIVQKDTSRLLAEQEKANDDDLLVLTENAIREAEIDLENQTNVLEETAADQDTNIQAQDTSSEYEFIPPSRLDEIKQNYRVDDEQQFRALDVYESESDLTESGIYSKAKPKVTTTIIRSLDSPSDSSASVEEVVEPSVQKTKRLRKRSFSANNHSHSESANNEDGENGSDSDDGVHSTGVPGIARGMAVERCKRKIRRISTRRNSEQNPRKEARTKKIMLSPSQEASSEEELPSAREIAERLLMQEKGLAREQPSSSDAIENLSVGSDAGSQGEAEFQDAMTDRIASVFERIEAQTRKSASDAEEQDASGYISDEEEDSRDKIVDSTVEETMDSSNELQEAIPDENDGDVPMEEPQIQVERNLPGLTDDSLPSGGQLIGWNEEMRRFYDDSWNGEHFSVHKLHRSMSAHRQEWKINNADRYPVMRPRSHAKCNNCAEMGHVRSKCPRPRKPLICFMCGIVGHAEPRCPNAICFGCGSKQAMYVQQCNKCSFHSRLVCQLCKMRGHGTDQCPDKWRRYHSTTRSNVELNSRVQYKLKQCSFCAGRGHLFENCRQRIGDFRSNNYTSQIVSHQKIYKDRSGPLGDLGDLDRFYALETPFYFQWSISQMPKNSYYSRFLIKVALARPQSVKRKSSTALIEMPAKVYFAHDYVPNAQAQAAQGEDSAEVESPEKEKEKEIPVDGEEEPNKEARVENEAAQEVPVEAEPPADEDEAASIQLEEITSNSQTQDAEETITARPPVASHELDSDSNYSFSEHFEVPSSTTIEDKGETLPSEHPLANLPDVIPLSASLDDDFEVSSNSQGISMCVNASSSNSGNKQQSDNIEEPRDIPCEGKIIMARDQSEYLFSPEGRTFLAAAAKQCQVSVRMDFKDYGYVLVIYGLKEHQEDLQLKLLRRHQEVKRKSIEFQSQKPPKRIDVLIRFLRDGINSLTTNLGNAKSHYIRIKALEEMNTKSGYKMAEKKRRQLNMILVGQAGLLNGNTHLDQLLVLLRRLVDDFSPDENATPELRNEIEEHWRMIFSSYPHPNYDSLINSYGRLDQKNRLPSLHLDPILLGLQDKKAPQSPAKRAPSPAKRAPSPTPPPPPAWRMAPPPPPPKMPKKKQRLALLLQQQTQQQQQLQNMMRQQLEQQHLQNIIQQQQNNHQQQRLQQQLQRQQQQRLQNQQQMLQHMAHQQQNHQQQQRLQQQQRRPQSTHVMPFNNPQQRSRADLHLRQTLNPECVNLLAEMESNERGDSINKDANKPSMFWSRESFKYLDDLFKMTSNSDTLERLNRVLQRSQRGQLSHNDYRAVIRLHTLLLN
ncbi:hypothetical protein KR038_009524, partial [Drosophila bunnanda]